MSQVLNKVRDVDPNNSDAVKDVLSAFFTNLTKHTDVDCNRWLRALESIINRFPRFCGTHRNTIETYLSSFLDSSNYYNVIEAAKCAHALQQVRPSQEKTATAKSCWREHVRALCNAAHKIIGSMFPNSVDLYKGNSNSEKSSKSPTLPLNTALAQILSIPKTYNNNVSKQTLLGTRLKNILIFLQAALVEIYPVAKPIKPQLILEVIVRALSVSSGVKEAQDITIACGVKIQALRTLDALVACLGPNLIPFSALIFKFVILTLKWCTDNLNEETREVRRSAYATLRQWLCTLHAQRLADTSRGRGWEDELAQHVGLDITPPRHVVQLTLRHQPTKHLSKKAKRKQTNTMLQESSIATHSKDKEPLSQQSNDDIAIAALDFAETFLNVCGVFMKPTTHKLFQERIVRECYNLDAHSQQRALALVRVLEALRKTAPATVPPPTQYCLQLYSGLVNHGVQEISKFCSQALLDIRLHLHCSPPSLNFAIEVPRPQKKVEQPRLSSKNRAALESLLGADKVPRDKEDIIDLENEPSNKKPRMEQDDDDITVLSGNSSDSDLEINEESESDEVEEISADNVKHKNNALVDDDNNEEDVVDAIENNEQTTRTDAMAKPAEEPQVITIDDNEDESNESGSVEESQDATSKDDSQDAASKDNSQDATSRDDSLESISKNSDETSTTVVTTSKDDSQESLSRTGSQETTSKDESQESLSKSGNEENNGKDSTTSITKSKSKEDSSSQEDNIHEIKTQMPRNTSTTSAEEPRSPRSMEVEVVYDFPNTGETRVTIIDRTEDENLPSTNDTDDVPITCGQVLKSSQELDVDKNKEAENKENEVPKVNGDTNLDKNINGEGETVSDKIAGTKEVSVDDMLADFVDEVVEENKA